MLRAPTLPIRPCPIPLLRARDIPHPDRAVARGEVVAVRRGVYAPAAAWGELAPWDRYLVRVHAASAVRPGLTFSHESAAVLLGLPVVGDPFWVHVVGDAFTTAGARSGLVVHSSAVPRETIDGGDCAVTSATECAVDIARSRHEVVGLSLADAVLRADAGLSVEILVARNEDRGSSRGRRLARWALHRASALAESTFESASRAVIEWLGYPAPELQQVFGDPRVGIDRSDFWWPGQRVAGEADGDLKYDGRFGDATVLLRERRRRDARIRSRGARQVAHWGWSDMLMHQPLDDLLFAAGLRHVERVDTARLVGARRALTASPAPSPAPSARQQFGAETAG
ncbi:hypothetical protein AB0N73_14575 [Microbacterium sp. NPDC089189]|uniref:hypothetical protein n=1 Tax=Microbacterium sp. NPDC089189 TaxID=3154972 RepID=UPI003438E67C